MVTLAPGSELVGSVNPTEGRRGVGFYSHLVGSRGELRRRYHITYSGDLTEAACQTHFIPSLSSSLHSIVPGDIHMASVSCLCDHT